MNWCKGDFVALCLSTKFAVDQHIIVIVTYECLWYILLWDEKVFNVLNVYSMRKIILCIERKDMLEDPEIGVYTNSIEETTSAI